ncbi:hypothetical protein [Arthrobacter sp. UYCo732]|uniref:hypothetical protein n=1 Tax=Arthrobacter sp. UYCo732 TaxID=3156336 RepID=UPI0033908F5B
MTTTTTPAPADTATCDKVRDPLKELPEFAGKVLWTCEKPPGHDNRGAHLMVNDKGQKTHWRGADNE